MIRVLRALALIGALAILGGAFVDDAEAGTTIEIRYSQFVQAYVEVPAGVPVTITLQNDDPIEHEWIVGPPEVHAVHRTGTEAYHDERPTEVTIPALSTRVTTITFDKPGQFAFICHLPGHEAYGMTGVLRVVDE